MLTPAWALETPAIATAKTVTAKNIFFICNLSYAHEAPYPSDAPICFLFNAEYQ